jgi:hypothetical protein
MEIVRLCCEQLPGVAILGIGSGQSKSYLFHIQQFVGLLKGNMERRGARRALVSYLSSPTGKTLKEQNGGDLLSAIQKGPLNKSLYTYRLKQREGGSSSQFVTMDGVKELLKGFPNAAESIKTRLDEVFESSSMSFLSFSPATLEQCARDDAEEAAIEEIFDGGDGFQDSGAAVGEQQNVVSFREMYGLRVAYIQSEAEKRRLEDKLDLEKERIQIRDEKVAVVLNAKDEQIKFCQEKAALEIKVKDMELANLQMQLELERMKNKKHMDEEDEISSKRPRKKSTNTSSHMAATTSLEPIPYAISSSPLLELSPFNDDPQKARICHKVRKYRWLITYSAESALNETDFEVDVTRVISIACGDGNWMSLTSLKDKLRLSQVISIVEELSSGGRIKGPVAIEVVHGGTHRFKTAAVHEGDLAGGVVKSYVSQSPSLMYEGGEAFFKMRTLF